MNSDDELYCEQIETNICDENEFRCRNGLCINRQFLFDGQGDCTDLTDEQSLLVIKKYHNFEHCFEQATFDCDEHWCGREMISCGDGECIPWNQRFWNGFDCSNFYTHVYNCELEERDAKSINFSITDNYGRCTMNITEFNANNDPCLLMIKCAVTLHPSCQSIGMFFTEGKDAYAYACELCQNRTLVDYASGTTFLSPFIRAYYTPKQFEIYSPDFFSKMKVRQPGLLCLIGEHMCRGIKVIHNGSTCFQYNDIFEQSYPFSPYDYLFCQSVNHSVTYCVSTTFFYRCQTSGECISKHRLFDGFVDCFDASDENNTEALNSLLPLFMKDRYNCWIKQQSNLSQWSGNCINPEWKCNKIWDYTDGSDEYDCNRTKSYPIPDCLLLDSNKIIPLNATNTMAGNGIVECSGGIDERVTFSCNDGFPLNERFLCNDQITCLKPMDLCNHNIDCPTGEDESEFWCGPRPSFNTSVCKAKEFNCLEQNDTGPCIPDEDRCNDE
ncbi:unnamed protein product, partial [Rotaria sp. Silwood1]